MPTLFICVHFHDGHYHGSGTWPPSPARLFQALVAGAARGETLSEDAILALKWLESLDAPTIAAPSAYAGQGFKIFVPNNDLDAVGGDPKRIGEIRAAKIIRPRTFDATVPLLYAWKFEPSMDAEQYARAICEIADNLYQLGRGVDMAWARGEIASENKADALFREHPGVLWRPSGGGEGVALFCPRHGSLESLTKRFKAMGKRFKRAGEGKTVLLFVQAPKPDFRPVPYNSPATLFLFEIRNADGFSPHPQERVVALTEQIRDMAVERLKKSSRRRGDQKRETIIEKVFIGRDAKEADKMWRIRIVLLPSIGHAQTERSIRRVAVEVPPDCPIASEDIAWAFSGVTLKLNEETGEVLEELVPAVDRAMLGHYGIEAKRPFRLWRTVTPAALPDRAARRRIDPHRMREEAKSGAERAQDNAAAMNAVRQALRHAGVDTPVQTIRVQREPFEARGRRAEAFANDTRFTKERLWHVEASFATPISGPLLIGDGRYLGLGLMAPVQRDEDIFAFTVTDGLTDQAEPLALSRALRRAVMARVQENMGARATLPTFFTGHAANGEPARSGRHKHLAFVFDAPRHRLLIITPHIIERREAFVTEREQYLPTLASALENFRELRAGAAGMLTLAPVSLEPSCDPLFAPSRIWESLTPYQVARHAKLNDAAAAIEADLLAECRRASLPRPQIEILKTFAKAGSGLSGRVRLTFHSAVAGPLLLGCDRHFGGGLFAGTK